MLPRVHIPPWAPRACDAPFAFKELASELANRSTGQATQRPVLVPMECASFQHFNREVGVCLACAYLYLMKSLSLARDNAIPLGIGYYTTPEAARLLEMPARTINRWLSGYIYMDRGKRTTMEPLWTPQLPRFDTHLELGFRDLIELRLLMPFIKAGPRFEDHSSLLNYARDCVDDERLFSTRRFRTDGRTIFLDTLNKSGDNELLDLKRHQYVLARVIESSFKDLDIDSATVSRWRPFNGKPSIVIDPERAFGQPIAAQSGVPTATLADAVMPRARRTRWSPL